MFVDVSHLVAPLPPGRYSCAAVADVDGDGWDELILGNRAGPNRVLKWVGGLLRDVTPAALADPDRPASAVVAADVDGDGREELYVATAASVSDRLFDPRPDGSWEDLFARPENRPVQNFNPVTALAVLDRRGAGRYGFVVAAADQRLRLFELPSDGLTDLAPSVGLDRDAETAFTCLLPVPLVSGKTDLLVSRLFEPRSLLTQSADGTYTDVAQQYDMPHQAEDVGTMTPISADTKFGVVIADWDAEHSLWWPQPDGSLRNVATPAFALPSVPVAVFAADFDNDGAEEILFLNVYEPGRLFRAGPHLVEAGALAAPVEPGAVAAVADLDNDGRLELLLVTADSVRLFRAAGPDHGWLRVQPLTRFGAPARGATVLLESPSRTLIRVIPGTAATDPVAHFGLGTDPAIDRVTVTWPDGAQHVTLAPDPCQLLRVPYPGG